MVTEMEKKDHSVDPIRNFFKWYNKKLKYPSSNQTDLPSV